MKKITVRLPEELYDELVKVSRRETRSINSTVLVSIERYCIHRTGTAEREKEAQSMSDLDDLLHDL